MLSYLFGPHLEQSPFRAAPHRAQVRLASASSKSRSFSFGVKYPILSLSSNSHTNLRALPVRHFVYGTVRIFTLSHIVSPAVFYTWCRPALHSALKGTDQGKSGVIQGMELRLPLQLSVVAIEKRPFGPSSTKVANFNYLLSLLQIISKVYIKVILNKKML